MQEMDDLDRLSLEVAISILQTETDDIEFAQRREGLQAVERHGMVAERLLWRLLS